MPHGVKDLWVSTRRRSTLEKHSKSCRALHSLSSIEPNAAQGQIASPSFSKFVFKEPSPFIFIPFYEDERGKEVEKYDSRNPTFSSRCIFHAPRLKMKKDTVHAAQQLLSRLMQRGQNPRELVTTSSFHVSLHKHGLWHNSVIIGLFRLYIGCH